MLSQLGTSIGLAATAVVSSSVTAKYGSSHAAGTAGEETTALMAGYRAAFWVVFAWTAVSVVLGMFGLRGVGRIGEKRD